MNYKPKILVGLFIIGIVFSHGCLKDERVSASDCEIIKDDSVKRNSCFVARGMLAKIEGNLDKCDETENQEDRDYCYYGAYTTIKDKTICDKIQNEAVKKKCLNETID